MKASQLRRPEKDRIEQRAMALPCHRHHHDSGGGHIIAWWRKASGKAERAAKPQAEILPMILNAPPKRAQRRRNGAPKAPRRLPDGPRE
jgi:hypothetical protein